jgi:anti-anti-sigma factor
MTITPIVKGSWLELRVEGRIDALEAELIYDAVCTHVANGQRDIRLDASAVDYISSAGLRALLRSRAKLSSTNGSFSVASASYFVTQALAMSGLSSMLIQERRQNPNPHSHYSSIRITPALKDGWLELHVEGKLDAGAADHLFKTICDYADKGRSDIRVDLGSLNYISSAGLRAMLQSQRKLSSLNGFFCICKASYFVVQTLSMAGLSALLVQE